MMVRTRARLDRLRTITDQVLEHMPAPHRLVVAPCLESLFSIITDLVDEVEKLRGNDAKK